MLKLKNGFYMNADRFGFILHQIKEPDRSEQAMNRLKALGREPKGEKIDVTIGHYNTLESALHGYAKIRMLNAIAENDLDLKEIGKLLKEINEEIAQVNV